MFSVARSHLRRFPGGIFKCAVLLPSCVATCALEAAVSVSDPSTAWTPLMGNYDFLTDQQTGQAQGDIVGVGTDYGIFVTFNNNGDTSATGGAWGFRLRLDATGGPPKKT